MNSYNLLKNELLQINADIISLISDINLIIEGSKHKFKNWNNICMGIDKHLSEEIFRVGTIGPIKSGKSTLVNSLFKGDYLKRGAGVVTSIVTRIRYGKRNTAKLYFKSWNEVNEDIEQAMILFPSISHPSKDNRFDIRNKDDRIMLEKSISTLGNSQLITDDTRNVSIVIMSSYLKGYEDIKDIVSLETTIKVFKDDMLAEHKAFVGNENLAVYLKDILLEIKSSRDDVYLEIADCQGSDSPNPLHLAMIQDYLLLTNLLIYVISSRTGLRRADIKFLSMIKKMGIIDNILFVINCDFFEHESLKELKTLIEKIREEISLIRPNPEIYTFSALYNLFNEYRNDLSRKDLMRFDQWKNEEDLLSFSNKETTSFDDAFLGKLVGERYSLLLKNHLERIEVIKTDLHQWIDLNLKILSKDAAGANAIVEKVNIHQEKMDRIGGMIKQTLEGSAEKIKKEMKKNSDRFFDNRSGEIQDDITSFIRNYRVSIEKYNADLKATGFSNTLYLVYQEFKHTLDTFITEKINPKIFEFVKNEEENMLSYMESIAKSYHLIVHDAIDEYQNAVSSFGIEPFFEKHRNIKTQDLETIKKIIGIKLPPAIAVMRYNTRIKTEAIMRLGLYNIIRSLKKFLKKPVNAPLEESTRALEDGIASMKRETEKSIGFHLNNYKENIKFQYFFKLVVAVSNTLYEDLLSRFQEYALDLSRLSELIIEKKIDKKNMSEKIKDIQTRCIKTGKELSLLKEKIEKVDNT